MSVIVAIRIKGMNILFSDVLFSTTNDHGYSITLPGSGEATHEFMATNPTSNYPVLLGQKLTIINEHLAVAVAGSLNVGIDYINYLKNNPNLNSESTFEDTKKILESFEYDDGDSFASLYSYHNKAEKVSVISGHNAQETKVEGYDAVYIAGSGSELFLQKIRERQIKFEDDDSPEWVKNRLRVTSILTSLWSLDLMDQENIKNAFGAGYEFAVFNKDEMIKVGDFLFTQIFVIASKDGIQLGINTRFVKVDYKDDYMIIRVVHLIPEENPEVIEFQNNFTVPDTNNRGYIILPTDKILPIGSQKIDPSVFKNLPDLNAEYCGVQLNVIAKNGNSLENVFAEWKPQRNSPIKFSNDGKNILITSDFFTKIMKKAQEFIDENEK